MTEHCSTFLSFACSVRSGFLYEKHSEAYKRYDEASIAEEKLAIALQIPLGRQLCWLAERCVA